MEDRRVKRNDAKKRMKGLFLAVALLLSALLPIQAGPVETAAFAEAAAPGVVRVLLTQLNLTDRLNVATDGSYSVEPGGLTFQRGSQLIISSAQGTLMLYYEGMAMDAGQQLILRRHALTDTQENGLRLNGNYSLFAGDLHISMNNGTLKAVLHIPLEEYLLGVVPYEMSDTFPLEALKAQAVTARTYALRKALGTQQQDYDLVDNTNDQVFKGFNPGNEQAIQAVQATEGVLSYFNGTLAESFYSASNGGQTELAQHVWDGETQGLSVIKDDPYDLANPLSVVKSYRAPKTWNQDAQNDALATLLKTAVAGQLAGMGYDSDINNIRIAAIESVTAHTPKYEEPSRLMTRLGVTLKVEGRKQIPATLAETDVSFVGEASATPSPIATPQAPQWGSMGPVPQNITVDLPIFPDVETALDLSIQGTGNEIVTVTETEDSFVIESRRFGHGVGMSQRGAEVMARDHGFSYAQILEFYYPGISFVKATAQAVLQPPIAAAFLATPGPAATPTPRPTLMPVSATPGPNQWRVKVTLIGANSSLNLRDTPSLNGNVVMLLYYGQKLLVLEELPDGWLHVKTDAAEGYVMASFVEKDE
jgi:SpoIID/LytB domain protein